jgi:hypothetical protein
MKKALAMLLVLGVLAQEGWTRSAAAIGGAVGGAVAEAVRKKHRKCNNSDGKSVNREACQRQSSEKPKDIRRGEERGRR